ncbi:MAG: CPBP family intramembrane metalloprotease [Methanosarcinales archaeon]|nr:CPBP family intramembrane metalloprotease [Methanosarcinales archaeon]
MTRIARIHHAIAILSVIAIVAGELLVFSGYITAGVAVHIINLQMIIVSMFVKREDTDQTVSDKRVLQSLLLLLQLRIINVSMPFFFTMTLYWYPMIYGPMFVAIYLILRHQNASFSDIGLASVPIDTLYYYLNFAMMLGGALALIEYRILSPDCLIPDLKITSMITLVIIMFFFVGLVEELIFRAILQTNLQQSIGVWKGLFVASVLFGIMHSGYGLAEELLFTTAAGLLIGYVYQKTGSLTFVTVIHGTINVLLFGILPHTL